MFIIFYKIVIKMFLYLQKKFLFSICKFKLNLEIINYKSLLE